jgi:hypothetical protein
MKKEGKQCKKSFLDGFLTRLRKTKRIKISRPLSESILRKPIRTKKK